MLTDFGLPQRWAYIPAALILNLYIPSPAAEALEWWLRYGSPGTPYRQHTVLRASLHTVIFRKIFLAD